MSFERAVRELVAELLPDLVAAELEGRQVAAGSAERMPEVMTTTMLAEHLGCTRQHINALINTGALRAKTDGNRRLILREWVIDYLHSDRSAPAMARADRERLRNRRFSSAGSSSVTQP